MFVLAIDKKFKMVVENPYTSPHYLKLYFPIRPAMIDKDRNKNGDYYRKPTQYWFVNFKPQTNFLIEPYEITKPMIVNKMRNTNGVDAQVMRSMINPQYARRFIYNNVLTREQVKEIEKNEKHLHNGL